MFPGWCNFILWCRFEYFSFFWCLFSFLSFSSYMIDMLSIVVAGKVEYIFQMTCFMFFCFIFFFLVLFLSTHPRYYNFLSDTLHLENSPTKYFMEEMNAGNSLRSTTTHSNDKERERVYDTIFRLPWRCELVKLSDFILKHHDWTYSLNFCLPMNSFLVDRSFVDLSFELFVSLSRQLLSGTWNFTKSGHIIFSLYMSCDQKVLCFLCSLSILVSLCALTHFFRS